MYLPSYTRQAPTTDPANMTPLSPGVATMRASLLPHSTLGAETGGRPDSAEQTIRTSDMRQAVDMLPPLGYSAIRKGEISRAFDSELAPAQLPGNMVPLLLSWIIRNCATPRDFCLEVISPTLYTYRSHMYLARDFFSATRSSSLSFSSPNPGSCAPINSVVKPSQ